MNQRYEDLNSVHIDVLREIGNIGAGNAATSLSMMLGQSINMTMPEVKLLSFDEAADAVGGAETLMYGVLLELAGDIRGTVMFLLDMNFAHLALNILMGETLETFDQMDEMSLSAICEIGNILSGSYVNSISELTGLNIELTVPAASVDMAGAMLNVPMTKFAKVGNKVMFIEEKFESSTQSVKSHMIMFAEIDSLNLILEKLGIL